MRPDTYQVSSSQDEIGILQAMVTEFDTNAKKLGLAAEVDGHSAYDIIKVASLIESEAKVPQDRPLIASVIYNRLAANMPLQIDSTVIYARGDPANGHLEADLDRRGRTTRACTTGLPPTPIGAVSDASLRAALAPAQTPYLYYVLAGKDGHHAFSIDLEEQQERRGARRLGLPNHGGNPGRGSDRRPGAPLLVAPVAQRGLPRARSRLGLRRLRGAGRRRARRPRRGSYIRVRRPVGDDAAQDGGGRAVRRAPPGRRGLAQREHGDAAARRAARGRLDRRRRVSAVARRRRPRRRGPQRARVGRRWRGPERSHARSGPAGARVGSRPPGAAATEALRRHRGRMGGPRSAAATATSW